MMNIHKCENCGCEKPEVVKDFKGRWAIECDCGTNSVYGLEENKMGTIRWWNDLMSKLEG